jgi:ketosteroid isomerase-like protein
MHTLIPRLIQQALTASLSLFFFIGVADGQQTNVISKADIQAVLDSIDKGLVKRDAAAVVAKYSPDAVMTARAWEDGGTTGITLKRDEYKQSLERYFQNLVDYSIQRKDVKIQIAPDGKTADCTCTFVEKMKYKSDGSKIESDTEASLSFAIFDGKVLVTKEDDDTTRFPYDTALEPTPTAPSVSTNK